MLIDCSILLVQPIHYCLIKNVLLKKQNLKRGDCDLHFVLSTHSQSYANYIVTSARKKIHARVFHMPGKLQIGLEQNKITIEEIIISNNIANYTRLEQGGFRVYNSWNKLYHLKVEHLPGMVTHPLEGTSVDHGLPLAAALQPDSSCGRFGVLAKWSNPQELK